MKDWSLMTTPEGEYILFLREDVSELDNDNSLCFKVSDEEAKSIVINTGCIIEELPF